MLYLVLVNANELNGMNKIKGNNGTWREDLKKKKKGYAKLFIIRTAKKMGLVRNETFHLKLRCLNYSLEIRNGLVKE